MFKINSIPSEAPSRLHEVCFHRPLYPRTQVTDSEYERKTQLFLFLSTTLMWMLPSGDYSALGTCERTMHSRGRTRPTQFNTVGHITPNKEMKLVNTTLQKPNMDISIIKYCIDISKKTSYTWHKDCTKIIPLSTCVCVCHATTKTLKKSI